MLQSMIMNVCVQCVFFVTTKCKAMRNIHLKELDDQETSNHFYICLYILLLLHISGPASTIKENCDDEKKHLHSVKYDTNFF